MTLPPNPRRTRSVSLRVVCGDGPAGAQLGAGNAACGCSSPDAKPCVLVRLGAHVKSKLNSECASVHLCAGLGAEGGNLTREGGQRGPRSAAKPGKARGQRGPARSTESRNLNSGAPAWGIPDHVETAVRPSSKRLASNVAKPARTVDFDPLSDPLSGENCESWRPERRRASSKNVLILRSERALAKRGDGDENRLGFDSLISRFSVRVRGGSPGRHI